MDVYYFNAWVPVLFFLFFFISFVSLFLLLSPVPFCFSSLVAFPSSCFHVIPPFLFSSPKCVCVFSGFPSYSVFSPSRLFICLKGCHISGHVGCSLYASQRYSGLWRNSHFRSPIQLVQRYEMHGNVTDIKTDVLIFVTGWHQLRLSHLKSVSTY